MDLPSNVLERFRRHGRRGGKSRAARMSAAERSQSARHAATKRWIRERFGSSDFASLGPPGGGFARDLQDADSFVSSGLVDPLRLGELVHSIPRHAYSRYPAVSQDAVLAAIDAFVGKAGG